MWRSRSRAGISTTRSCGSATPCVEHQGHGRLPFARSSNTSCRGLPGARVEQTERPALLRTVVERTAHNAAELVRRSESGDPAYQRMVNDGHADVWQKGSDHVAANLDKWLPLLESAR